MRLKKRIMAIQEKYGPDEGVCRCKGIPTSFEIVTDTQDISVPTCNMCGRNRRVIAATFLIAKPAVRVPLTR